MKIKTTLGLAGSLAALLAVAAWGGGASGEGGSGGGGTELALIGYSVLLEANQGVIADFQDTDAGKDVTFKESYGASGDQSRAFFVNDTATTEIYTLSLHDTLPI